MTDRPNDLGFNDEQLNALATSLKTSDGECLITHRVGIGTSTLLHEVLRHGRKSCVAIGPAVTTPPPSQR